jgi:hypothetical protein
VGRSAQDDVFVVSWRSKKPAPLLSAKQVSAYGAAPRFFHPMYAVANMGHPSGEEGFVLRSVCNATVGLHLGRFHCRNLSPALEPAKVCTVSVELVTVMISSIRRGGYWAAVRSPPSLCALQRR